MNVLGVLFDCKLDWKTQVASAIKKANKSLYAIRMIKKYFKPTELKILLNTHFFPILYYNCEIWLTPSLQTGPKQQLLSASAHALRTCMNYPNHFINFDTIHKNFKKSTPTQFSLYKISLLLFKVLNNEVQGADWVDLNVNIITTSRQSTFDITRSDTYKIGNNILTYKLWHVKRKIHLDHLYLSYPAYKRKMKSLFLPYES